MSTFEGEVRKQNKAVDVLAWTAGLLGVLVLAAVFWPVTGHNHTPYRSKSISNTKQVALGMIMYASAWDEHLPLTSKWEDRISMYLKSKDLVKLSVPTGKPSRRLAFNTSVSRTDTSTMENATETVLVFESDTTIPNSIGGLGLVTPMPDTTQAVIGFVDGHAQFKGIGTIPSLVWKPTFTVPVKKSSTRLK